MKKQKKSLKSTVGERGQVTIPKVFRDTLGIAANSILLFELAEGKLVVSKAPSADAVGLVYGCLKDKSKFLKTDDYIGEIRGESV